MRPCPVCGSDAYIRPQWMGREMCWHYICTQCEYEGPKAETAEEARKAWNEQED